MSKLEVANYIAAMASELSELAKKEDMALVAYICGLIVEAANDERERATAPPVDQRQRV